MQQCSVACLYFADERRPVGRLECKHNFNVLANCKYEVIRKNIAQTGGPFRADNRTSAVVRIGHHESVPGSSKQVGSAVRDCNLVLLLPSAHDGNTPARTSSILTISYNAGSRISQSQNSGLSSQGVEQWSPQLWGNDRVILLMHGANPDTAGVP